ncbi:hypothetical protein KGD82_11165 [Nocardiopsis eucommiae]|uniref:Uncharacterized protein n=1 Tax=Nocardiopsis eucommiae TaxID=2831970 RepID=A0A975QKJ2_9ACTN|nr:hypothetical protein KGD82_11165 [Nocardiopsis eucommiae]
MTGDQRQAEGLVEFFLDDRLRGAQEPPGVRDAAANKIAPQLKVVQDRCGEQISQLRSPSSKRIPDAYFHDEEVLENALQEAVAGIRTAHAAAGWIAPDARAQEATYASTLAPSARWATLAEASRVPRPTTRHRTLSSTLAPIAWHENGTGWPPQAAIDLANTRQLAGSDPVRVAERPYINWVQLGLFEHQRTFATRFPDEPGRQLIITTGVEVIDRPAPPDSLPLGQHPPHLWLARYNRLVPTLTDEAVRTVLNDFQGPLTAMVSYEGEMGAPGRHRGAGLHPAVLSPRIEVAAYLGLRPEQPAIRHHLIDDQGPAVVGRLWHGFLVHDGNYTPSNPLSTAQTSSSAPTYMTVSFTSSEATVSTPASPSVTPKVPNMT